MKFQQNNKEVGIDMDLLDQQSDYLSILENELKLDYSLNIMNCDFDIEVFQRYKDLIIPEVPNLSFNNWKEINEEWPKLELDLFPRWRTADIPMMIIIGFLGGLISYGLHDVFEQLHETWGENPFEAGGHSGQDIDKVRGKKHRFKYGHDILNPFEIDWDNYFPSGKENSQYSMFIKIIAWLKHLFQDTFSTEGLPLPGSSYFREQIEALFEGMSNNLNIDKYTIYKIFSTLKTRDLVGTAFVASAMSIYIYGTEKGNDRKFFNYRYTSLTLGALLVNISTGLCMPEKKASLNYSGIAAMIPYFISLILVNRKINAQIKKHKEVIDHNIASLINKDTDLLNNNEIIEEYNKKMETVINNMNEIYINIKILSDESYDESLFVLQNQNEWLISMEKSI